MNYLLDGSALSRRISVLQGDTGAAMGKLLTNAFGASEMAQVFKAPVSKSGYTSSNPRTPMSCPLTSVCIPTISPQCSYVHIQTNKFNKNKDESVF